MVHTFLQLLRRLVAYILPIDQSKLLEDLNGNFMAKREPSMITGRLSLNYGKYMAIMSAGLLTAKNVELDKNSKNTSEELDKNLENSSEELR